MEKVIIKSCLLVPLLFVLLGCCSVKQKNIINGERFAIPDKPDLYLKDFGIIRAGEIVKYSFEVKNKSNKTLRIKNVTTSCGCTVSGVRNKIINPGESTFVDVKFNSKGYSGQVEQFVYVSTDGLDDSLIRFIIRAKVI